MATMTMTETVTITATETVTMATTMTTKTTWGWLYVGDKPERERERDRDRESARDYKTHSQPKKKSTPEKQFSRIWTSWTKYFNVFFICVDINLSPSFLPSFLTLSHTQPSVLSSFLCIFLSTSSPYLQILCINGNQNKCVRPFQ